MEGVRIFSYDQLGVKSEKAAKEIVERDLRETMENLTKKIFGDSEFKWVYDHFPFTDPSLELEVFYEGDWLEILGSGVIHN